MPDEPGRWESGPCPGLMSARKQSAPILVIAPLAPVMTEGTVGPQRLVAP